MSLAISGLLLAAVPVAAHHAIAAQYDMDKAGEWTGTLKKMEFINPHSMLHLDVTGPDGKVTEWVFQTTNAGTLRTRGLARTGQGRSKSVRGTRSRDSRRATATRWDSCGCSCFPTARN